jgi:hypothetical protein
VTETLAARYGVNLPSDGLTHFPFFKEKRSDYERLISATSFILPCKTPQRSLGRFLLFIG